MPMRYLEYVNPQTKWGKWAWSPIIVLRVSLLLTYVAYVYAAGIALLSGVPIFNNATTHEWRVVWALILGISALVAAIGSLSDRWQKVERWASMGLSAMMISYAISLNLAGYVNSDLSRQFVGAVAVIALALPLTRFVYLAAQSGKKHVEPK